MIIARQSTARIVTVGPVLDASGVAVTGGVVGDFKISKNGGAPAALNASATATHRHTGFYSLSLTASDLDTVGSAEITIDDTVNACGLKDITVIEEAVYDAMFAASAAGYQVPIWSSAGATVNLSATTVATVTTTTTATNLTNERGKYAEGAVWIGPTANTNTVSYTDGIITNPVSTVAAAKTIADALGLRRFHTTRTGSTQIGAAMVGYDFDGEAWSLTTTGGSRDVGTSSFERATLAGGTFAATSGVIHWFQCEFPVAVSVGVSNFTHCTFGNTLTLSEAGSYDFIDCASIVAGTSAPVFAVPAGTVNISFRRWSGGIRITGITSGTTISIDIVSGGTVTLEGADGNVQIRGMASTVTDSRTGSPTLGTNAVINQTTIATPTNITAGTITTVSGNVTGSVGSVTGAVGSVTGAVGSVTGNVGGNVVGSVASVTAGVTLANGAHGGTSAVITAERIVVASTTTNEPGIKTTGNGTAAGILATGGATGDGLKVVGGGTSGHGMNAVATAGNSNGILTTGQGTADGMHAQGGATGIGLHARGGVTSGSGIAADALGSNSYGMYLLGTGSAEGLVVNGGATGNGVLVMGGGTSGDGIKITTTSGHGINLAPVGTNKHGILSTGGNGGTSDGISLVAGTGGVGLRAGSLTVTGATTLSGAVSFGSTWGITGAITFSSTWTGNLTGTVATVTTLTGHTPQTGDSFARIGATGSGLTSLAPSTLLSAALTEGYRGTGATGSATQLLYEILANLTEFSIASTTKTAKKIDGSTTAKTYTLDSATTPTSITETT